MSVIADTALQYIGTPFIHQGRSRNGLDCVGLLVQVAKDLGLKAADFTEYSLRPKSAKLLAMLEQSCIQVDEMETGDILIFQFIGPGWPQHAAIKTERGMVHSYRGHSVIEVSYDAYWAERLHSVWRFHKWPR